MFRFDGEVFLFGTAMRHLQINRDNNRNCDDLRLISAGVPAGGGWIVANRGSYSETGACCKLGMAVRRGRGEDLP
jgi:hypothetical protein